jgi:hypothetical protein
LKMQMFRQRKYLFAAAALVLVFAGCKGESPTAPNSGPTTTGGGVTPPTGANVTITASNSTPQVNGISTITATVTENNQPVPNGTAVEFTTNLGTFTEGNAQTLIRTTTNGIATVTLTSATVGPATVSATVSNVKKTTTVTFSALPTQPQPPDTTPAITSINPTTGRPQGGEVVTINGKNFRTPLRVLFDFGAGTIPKDATIISSTSTTIQVLTPSVDLGVGQQKIAAVKLVNEVGTPNEFAVTGPNFTFQAEVLTPKITTVAPTSGPIDGGTKVTIFGEGFQAPVQVFFGSAEAQVLNVTFSQMTVISPTARDTTPDASGTFTGFVDVKVININSNTNVTAAKVFRYIPKMAITTISPVFGSAVGGTQVRIDGTGFNDPLTVNIAGVRAQVISVSGTQILARTTGLASPCTGTSGSVVVTNTDNGDEATSPSSQSFTYIAVNPLITAVVPGGSPPFTIGSPLTVTVQDPGVGPLGSAIVGFSIQDKPTTPSPQTINVGTGTQNFTMSVPAGITFPTLACTVGTLAGTQSGPATVNVTFTNITTSCTATATNALTIQPTPAAATCVTVPHATLTGPPQNCPITSNLSPASQTATGNATQTVNITISNAATSSTLNLGAPAVTPVNGVVVISPNTAQQVPGGSTASYTFTIDPTAAGPDGATITFTTNDPAAPTITVTVCGTATP